MCKAGDIRYDTMLAQANNEVASLDATIGQLQSLIPAVQQTIATNSPSSAAVPTNEEWQKYLSSQEEQFAAVRDIKIIEPLKKEKIQPTMLTKKNATGTNSKPNGTKDDAKNPNKYCQRLRRRIRSCR